MLTATELHLLRGSQLDELFTAAPAGPIPVGIGRGQALIAGGTFAARPLVGLVRLLAWRGKEFDVRSRRAPLRFALQFDVAPDRKTSDRVMESATRH